LLRTLLEPDYQRGAVVDGFPRTRVQVSCLKMFYDRMIELRNHFRDTPQANDFPKPLFHSVLLFVDEEESVARQLKRGHEALENNKRVKNTGVGAAEEVRHTDLDAEAARRRYRVFKETTYDALQSLRQIFHFHFIDAEAALEEVQEKIGQEFAYQSSLELEHNTFDRIHGIPLASQIVHHARQELVLRLDAYNQQDPRLFERVVAVIQTRFIPIIQRYAIAGLSLINSEDTLFEEPAALAMLIDIFSERGYQVVVDVNLVDVPDRFDLKTGQISCHQKRIYRFQVRFTASAIRRGSDRDADAV
jgi:adenylate kinase